MRSSIIDLYCVECGAKMHGKYCRRCGAAAIQSEDQNAVQVVQMSADPGTGGATGKKIAFVSVALVVGVGFFIFPAASVIVSLVCAVYLVFASRNTATLQ